MTEAPGLKGVRARRVAEREALLERARRWVRELNAELRLERAVVFGSVARGDFNRWSDIDLLLVSSDFDGPPLRRLERLGDRPGGVQPACWTPDEWRSQLERSNPIAVESEETGVDVLPADEVDGSETEATPPA